MPSDNQPTNAANQANDGELLVVGLGASAGGIQALKEFFAQVPADSGIGYVVILHMSPEHESRLAEILQVTSAIPVTQVTKREKIEPNHVYVVPPTQNLAMADGHVTLKDKISPEERRSPVDLFFRTLAETREDRAISVILSGTGANGSMGLKRIKEYGGVSFVQDPSEAQYNDMPRNAIATGLVDHVLPVAEIPAKIISYKKHLGKVQLPDVSEDAPKTEEQGLSEIFLQLRIRTGHDFSNYKRGTIVRRIERRLGLRELSDLRAYANYLREYPAEVQALMKDLLISVTNFFRDAESIEALAKNVIPKIFAEKDAEESVRIWVAGCATGEEAYSIAILFSEYLTRHDRVPNIQIFATDLDDDAIAIAREGFYRDSEVADISPERLRRFFNREGNGYRVRREIRESILFAIHNVIKDPPFSHLDFVSCRNLLIYLNRTAQARALEIFHFALNPSGYLLLGASESAEGAGDLFVAEDKDHRIFRGRPVPTRSLPIPDITFRAAIPVTVEKPQTAEQQRAVERLSFADLHQRLLEQYAPPSLIVNEQYDIVHLSDRAGRYLQITGGDPSHNLMKVIRPELRLELRTALYQAVHDRINVEVRDLRVATDDSLQTINIMIRPVLRDDDLKRGFLLVLFEDAMRAEPRTVVDKIPPIDEPIARRLEEELIHSRDQLRSTIEQYEIQQEELRASNEELLAMNEELRSAAEELETSKEELQSVNEELSTVNQELKVKIDELSLANNNFANLMNSTNIGTIFLDRQFQVRQFTPAITETFNLIGTDIGRPLADITHKLTERNLLLDLKDVLDNLRTIEREVTTVDGRSFIMRLLPYRTVENKIDGIIITFVDVSQLSNATADLRKAGEQLESRVATRTAELSDTNESLRSEVAERLRVEKSRLEVMGQLVKAQEDERQRFARDLHDQLGQQLTALRLKLESMNERHEKEAGLGQEFKSLQDIVKQLDSDVDFLAWQLRPVVLDDLGLSAALANYVTQWSQHFEIPAEFHSGNLQNIRLNGEIETNLYRIVQEALNNCAKHAKCKTANVLLEKRGQDLVLIIEDDGDGFDQQKKNNGHGFIGMRERAALIKGTIEVESTHGDGTTIFVRVPLGGDRKKK